MSSNVDETKCNEWRREHGMSYPWACKTCGLGQCVAVKPTKLKRGEAAKQARETIRNLMAECEGSELQRLRTFANMLTRELWRIDERIDELRPDEWGT